MEMMKKKCDAPTQNEGDRERERDEEKGQRERERRRREKKRERKKVKPLSKVHCFTGENEAKQKTSQG